MTAPNLRRDRSSLGLVFAVVVAVVWTLPLTGVLVTALRPSHDAVTDGWWNVTTDPSLTLDHLRTVLDGAGPVSGMWGALGSSLAIAVPATALVVVVALAAAHAMVWTEGRGRRALWFVAIGLLFVPLQAVLVPLVAAYDDTGLRGTLPGLWLAHLAFGLPLAVVLLAAALRTVPGELVEAARADGAGHVALLGRVLVPLVAPAVAGVAMLQFLFVWNDLLVAVALLGDPRSANAPLPLVLADMVRTWPNELHLHGAAVLVTVSVPLVVFAGLHRLMINSLVAGAGPAVLVSEDKRPLPPGGSGRRSVRS